MLIRVKVGEDISIAGSRYNKIFWRYRDQPESEPNNVCSGRDWRIYELKYKLVTQYKVPEVLLGTLEDMDYANGFNDGANK